MMRNKRLWTFLLAFCLCGIVGCVEIERTIRLNVDGSGQLVEVIRFDDRLVQTAKSSPQFDGLLDFLEEKHVRERLALYGAVTLVCHDVKDLGGKGRQATTVLAFKNINQLTLPALPHRSATPDRPERRLPSRRRARVQAEWAESREHSQAASDRVFRLPARKTSGVETAPDARAAGGCPHPARGPDDDGRLSRDGEAGGLRSDLARDRQYARTL